MDVQSSDEVERSSITEKLGALSTGKEVTKGEILFRGEYSSFFAGTIISPAAAAAAAKKAKPAAAAASRVNDHGGVDNAAR